jgi:flagellar FliJ protein
MPSFRFALQVLLDERRRAEEAAERAYARLTEAHDHARSELVATDAAIASCSALPATGDLAQTMLRDALSYAELLQARRLRVQLAIERTRESKEAARQTLAAARLARERLEALRRSAYEEFLKEQRFAEERELEETNRTALVDLLSADSTTPVG